jgi:hypothetical protein
LRTAMCGTKVEAAGCQCAAGPLQHAVPHSLSVKDTFINIEITVKTETNTSSQYYRTQSRCVTEILRLTVTIMIIMSHALKVQSSSCPKQSIKNLKEIVPLAATAVAG